MSSSIRSATENTFRVYGGAHKCIRYNTRQQQGVQRVRAFEMRGIEKLVAKTPRSFVPGGRTGNYPLWGMACLRMN